MSEFPTDLKYADSHEWARLEDDGSVTVGISDFAQSALGDVVYIELPEVDTPVQTGEEAGVVESVKAASDIYSPVTGIVVAVNEKLEDAPELVNEDAFCDGWLFKVQPDDALELEDLLDAEAYEELCENESH